MQEIIVVIIMIVIQMVVIFWYRSIIKQRANLFQVFVQRIK